MFKSGGVRRSGARVLPELRGAQVAEPFPQNRAGGARGQPLGGTRCEDGAHAVLLRGACRRARHEQRRAIYGHAGVRLSRRDASQGRPDGGEVPRVFVRGGQLRRGARGAGADGGRDGGGGEAEEEEEEKEEEEVDRPAEEGTRPAEEEEEGPTFHSDEEAKAEASAGRGGTRARGGACLVPTRSKQSPARGVKGGDGGRRRGGGGARDGRGRRWRRRRRRLRAGGGARGRCVRQALSAAAPGVDTVGARAAPPTGPWARGLPMGVTCGWAAPPPSASCPGVARRSPAAAAAFPPFERRRPRALRRRPQELSGTPAAAPWAGGAAAAASTPK